MQIDMEIKFHKQLDEDAVDSVMTDIRQEVKQVLIKRGLWVKGSIINTSCGNVTLATIAAEKS